MPEPSGYFDCDCGHRLLEVFGKMAIDCDLDAWAHCPKCGRDKHIIHVPIDAFASFARETAVA